MATHAISADGIPVDPNIGDVLISIKKRTVTLTDADIKSLPTTPFEILSAPGIGKVIIPIAASIVFDTSAGGYTEVTGAIWFLKNGSQYASNPMVVTASLTYAAKAYMQFAIPSTSAGVEELAGMIVADSRAETYENQPLVILDDWNGLPNYTGGNAANTAKVTIAYSIMDLT